MQRALRAAVRGVREPSHDERAEFAAATPETRAFLTVKMHEQMIGRRASPIDIRRIANDMKAYAEALATLADERERQDLQAETGDNGLGFSLDEIAADADAKMKGRAWDRGSSAASDADLVGGPRR